MPGCRRCSIISLQGAEAQGTALPEPAPLHLGRRHHAGDVEPRIRATFRVPLLDGYGITETSTMVTMNWPTGGRVLGSCGLPVPGLPVRIVDPTPRAAISTPGGEGSSSCAGRT